MEKPMDVKVLCGTLNLERGSQSSGPEEIDREFCTLEELFTLCLNAAPHAVDGIVLHGQDAQGRQRRVTFSFRSMTVLEE
jgi:hypothetical protein